MRNILLTFFCLTAIRLNAQQFTQTVRGTVTDKISQTPLPGVRVVLAGSEPKKGVTTDANGVFKFTEVPVGKHTFTFTTDGYKNFILPNVVVNSGKEVVLNISLEENIVQGQEVVVVAKVNKNKPLNDMSVVSSRTFSVEETQKYAAAFNDPARMAAAFPGVVQTGDPSNTISIRGNSPNGLLWRMEGVEIPNPNHFSNVGTAGGGISILSAQLLTNSDFSTGAFAAEYGNALSGVFDLKLRKGNNEKHEYTVQTGFLGIDLSAEGPFKKGYGGSYLINYRYSTLGVISKLGIEIGDASTLFQDLSFNIALPVKKLGNFTLFGFGGLSSQTTDAIKDTTQWDNEFYRYNTDFRANTGAAGITHTLPISKKSFLKTAVVYSGTKNAYYENRLNDDFSQEDRYSESFINKKITLQSVYNLKIDSRHSLRNGFILNNLGYSFIQKAYYDSTGKMEDILNAEGNAYSGQAFAQWKFRVTEKITFNTGLHSLYFFLNDSWSVEPRASFKYDISPLQSVSIGYGLHSQIQPLGVYFARDITDPAHYSTPNKNLGLSKAHHYVVAYDLALSEYWRIKIETYYQWLFNIPQGSDSVSNYSVLNKEDGFDYIPMNNGGTGQNYGVELTIEQFMHNNFYLLAAVSFFDSKYKGNDGNIYNTRFNASYSGSLTAGKEFQLSEKRKKRVIGINTKTIYTGGFRQTPVDVAATEANGYTVTQPDKAYTEKMPAYFRPDIGISLKRNYKKVTATLSLDIQNVTNRQNVGGRYYDMESKQLKYYYTTGIIPILSYRLQF
ncbi:MAG TPA: TonB-dependent receptor [Flavobacteriales bacterium]|nr:TonB-dependent receptor [Flavobacteriales bacterium]